VEYAYDEENAVQLTGNELGTAHSLKELKDKVRQYARENFVYDYTGKEFEIKSCGNSVRISMGGVKHTLGHPKASEDDMYAVIALPKLLERSIKGEDGETYSKRPNINRVERYYASLKIGKNRYIAEMIVLVEKGREEKGTLSHVRFFHHQRIKGPVDP